MLVVSVSSSSSSGGPRFIEKGDLAGSGKIFRCFFRLLFSGWGLFGNALTTPIFSAFGLWVYRTGRDCF